MQRCGARPGPVQTGGGGVTPSTENGEMGAKPRVWGGLRTRTRVGAGEGGGAGAGTLGTPPAAPCDAVRGANGGGGAALPRRITAVRFRGRGGIRRVVPSVPPPPGMSAPTQPSSPGSFQVSGVGSVRNAGGWGGEGGGGGGEAQQHREPPRMERPGTARYRPVLTEPPRPAEPPKDPETEKPLQTVRRQHFVRHHVQRPPAAGERNRNRTAPGNGTGKRHRETAPGISGCGLWERRNGTGNPNRASAPGNGNGNRAVPGTGTGRWVPPGVTGTGSPTGHIRELRAPPHRCR